MADTTKNGDQTRPDKPHHDYVAFRPRAAFEEGQWVEHRDIIGLGYKEPKGSLITITIVGKQIIEAELFLIPPEEYEEK